MKRLAFALLLLPSLACAQAFRVGKGAQIVPGTAAPTRAGTNGEIWIDSTASNVLKYTNPAGTTITLGAAGGGSTLAVAYAAGASQTDSTFALDSTRLGLRIRDNATPITGDLFAVQNSAGSTTTLGARATGLTVSAVVQTSGTVSPVLLLTPVAHTGMTAATEYYILNSAGPVTLQWTGGGSFTSQRFHVFRQNTISFTSSTTVTDAATVAITGAPSQGTNAVLTNTWALWVASGESLFERNIVGSTIGTKGLTIGQRQSAGLGAQQYSPLMSWRGEGWGTGGGASQTIEIGAQLVTVQGVNATGSLNYYFQRAAGGWSSSLFSIGETSMVASVPITANLGSTTVAPTWTAVSYTAGGTPWIDFNGTVTSRYTKDAHGEVTLEVKMKTSGGGAGNTTAFTLPAGFRPGQNQQPIGYTATPVITTADLLTTGAFNVSGTASGSGTFFCFRFYAEN